MAHTFRDAPFMSAYDKELVLKSWVRFLKNGLRFEDFSDRLYQHLILHCSFIAHYGRQGFYETYFENGDDTVRFLSQFDERGECQSVEYGGGWWLQGDYGDLNRAMVDEAAKYVFWNPRTQTRYERINSTFQRARRKAGFPGLQLKDFRRELGILLAESGQPLHVAKTQLGHSTVRTTEQYYAHYSPEYAIGQARQVMEARWEANRRRLAPPARAEEGVPNSPSKLFKFKVVKS